MYVLKNPHPHIAEVYLYDRSRKLFDAGEELTFQNLTSSEVDFYTRYRAIGFTFYVASEPQIPVDKNVQQSLFNGEGIIPTATTPAVPSVTDAEISPSEDTPTEDTAVSTPTEMTTEPSVEVDTPDVEGKAALEKMSREQLINIAATQGKGLIPDLKKMSKSALVELLSV